MNKSVLRPGPAESNIASSNPFGGAGIAGGSPNAESDLEPGDLFAACGEVIERILHLGCSQLGLPVGAVAHIANERYELMRLKAPDDLELAVHEGERLMLACTFCSDVARSGEVVAFNRASGTQWRNHPGYGELRFEAYVGAPLRLDGEVVGSLSFASTEPRFLAFQPLELELVASLAQWLGRELEAERTRRRAAARELLCLVQLATGDAIYDWSLTEDRIRFHSAYRDALPEAPGRSPISDSEVWLESLHPEDRGRVMQGLEQVLTGTQERWSAEYRRLARDGEYVHVLDRGWVVRDPYGKALRMVGLLTDITARKHAELTLQESEQRYELALRGASDGLWDWDLQHNVIHYSPHWKTLLGYGQHEIGNSPDDWFKLIASADLSGLQEALALHLGGHTVQLSNEHRIRHRNGTFRWFLCRGIAVRDASGQPLRLAGSLTDITERKEIEETLQRAALQDSLTGLPNRRMFNQRLDQALSYAKRRPEYRFAVLFLDFDRFKVINDSLGHEVGDHLLIDIAERLRGQLRATDLAARLGGDEFVVLLDDLRDADLQDIVERLQQTLLAPYHLNELEVCLTVSIGIVASDASYERPQDILRDADTAMYHAKAAGRARHALFDARMHEEAVLRLDLERDLRKALERDELFLVYQPIISLDLVDTTGFEALIRWRHPERGVVNPGRFIPIAEETGLITALGLWVLREACKQLQAWETPLSHTGNGRNGGDHGGNGHHRDASAVLHPLTMNVNVSKRQLAHPDFVEQVRQVLEETGIDPSRLQLEITETVVVDDRLQVIPVLMRLKDLGLGLSMDDFGTGLSSLSCLHRFPIDELKIDRAFIQNLNERIEYQAIIKAVVTLAHSLDIRVVAEGIEEALQLTQIHAMGCDLTQGFYFAHPMSSADATTFLRKPNGVVRPGGRLYAPDGSLLES